MKLLMEKMGMFGKSMHHIQHFWLWLFRWLNALNWGTYNTEDRLKCLIQCEKFLVTHWSKMMFFLHSFLFFRLANRSSRYRKKETKHRREYSLGKIFQFPLWFASQTEIDFIRNACRRSSCAVNSLYSLSFKSIACKYTIKYM